MININANIPIIIDELLNSGIVVKPKGRKIFPKVIGIAGRFLIKATIPETEEGRITVIALILKRK